MDKRSLRHVRRLAKDLGYIEQARGKHLRFFQPVTNKLVIVSLTPSCPYGFKNAERDLQRCAK
jgi:hypothetical protein